MDIDIPLNQTRTLPATRGVFDVSLLRGLVQFVRQRPLAATSGLIILLLVGLAVAAPLVAPHDIYALSAADRLQGPGSRFWLGTDEFGRDQFSRLIYGARSSLLIGFSAVFLGSTVGSGIGLVSGYLGGRVDSVVQRIMDALLALPSLVLALAMIAVLGNSKINVILAISVGMIPTANRVVRVAALTIRNLPYTEAAHAIGCSDWRIVTRHVLPNCIAPFIVMTTISLGGAIVAEASLSFLGLGTPPPEPSWGAMLGSSAQTHMRSAPWLAIFPGLAITITVFAFNLLGDGVRDHFDPRLRRR